MGKGIERGLGTSASSGFGVNGLAGDCTLAAGAKRFCCAFVFALGRDIRLGAFDATATVVAAAAAAAVSLEGWTAGFGRRGGWSAAGSADVLGRSEAGIAKGAGKGVAGAATVTAGTASAFALVLGDAAFEVAPGL